MIAFHILHVDDEPDIRDIVELSLGLEPGFVVRSCGSGQEALTIAQDWLPDIIVLDVIMPGMDGPTTLVHLRADSRTAGIPVVFMTGRTRDRELGRLRALGAAGVIAKPFDPLTLAASIHSYLKPLDARLDALRLSFLRRVAGNIDILATHRPALEAGTAGTPVLEDVRSIAHGLAGAGGIFGFAELGDAAARLEDATIRELSGEVSAREIPAALDHLIACAAAVMLPSE